jgi:hypothetical protein
MSAIDGMEIFVATDRNDELDFTEHSTAGGYGKGFGEEAR